MFSKIKLSFRISKSDGNKLTLEAMSELLVRRQKNLVQPLVHIFPPSYLYLYGSHYIYRTASTHKREIL